MKELNKKIMFRSLKDITFLFFLFSIPIGIVSYILGFKLFASIILAIWFFNLVFFITAIDNIDYDALLRKRTKEDHEIIDKSFYISSICIILIFINIACVTMWLS